jgi:alpha-L-fucosidase
MLFKQMREKTFTIDYARRGDAAASPVRGNEPQFAASNVNDGDPETYWSTGDGATSGSVTLTFASPTIVDCVMLQEYTPLGQRVEEFSIDEWNGDVRPGAWSVIDTGTTIGYKRLIRFSPRPISKIRLNVVKSRACPAISTFGLFKENSR